MSVSANNTYYTLSKAITQSSKPNDTELTVHRCKMLGDFLCYCKLYCEAFGFSIVRILAFILNARAILKTGYIAKINKQCIGAFIFLGDRNMPVLPEGSYTIIYNVSIAKTQRGKGYGKLLMQHAEYIASLQGYSHLVLLVLKTNEIAIKMYTSLGYSALEET